MPGSSACHLQHDGEDRLGFNKCLLCKSLLILSSPYSLLMLLQLTEACARVTNPTARPVWKNFSSGSMVSSELETRVGIPDLQAGSSVSTAASQRQQSQGVQSLRQVSLRAA